MPGVRDKEGQPIEVGDTVETKFRGGKRTGKVEAVIENQHDLKERDDTLNVDVKNPPKVVYTDQHGHQVSHNPGTLSHVEEEEKATT
ncbi:hypothetical protein BD309DRAFT_931428 [Dichomitus squalens]|uniref:Uncharacterized protein n=1 Tax=Dichomitus squalens TaxID=114155 RepID=A0A4Q9MIX7_9APHY|nr:hypothetical protein BD311DRAFT_696377 [Dichomitus squalens]TBU38029.1 hypothetical protein BD309DRAFT_931428 [Dichomitus squalens]